MGRKDRQVEQRRQRIGQLAIALFIVILMVLSMFAFVSDPQQSGTVKYNGQTFTRVPDGFFTEAGGQELLLHSLPLERNGTVYLFQDIFNSFVEIDADPLLLSRLRDAAFIVVTFDPDTSASAIPFIEQVRFDLSQQLPDVISAKAANSTAYPALPVVTCADAQPDMPVISFVLLNESERRSSIVLDGECIVVSGDPQGLLVGKDFLLLSYYGVFDEQRS